MSEWASFLQLFHLSGWILPSEYLLNASQSHPHSWQFAAFWTSWVGHHQHHLLDQAPESPPSYLLPHSSSAELTRLLTTINTSTIMSSLEESICNILNQFNHQESERSSSACTRTRFLFLCSSLQNTSWWPEHTSNSSTWFKRKFECKTFEWYWNCSSFQKYNQWTVYNTCVFTKQNRQIQKSQRQRRST